MAAILSDREAPPLSHQSSDIPSELERIVADRSVRHDGRTQVWYLMGKGRFDEAQTVIDEWSRRPPNINVPPTQALLLASRGDFRDAEAQIPAILGSHPVKDPLYHHATYDIACIYAMEGKSAEAVKWLRESAASGYHLYPRYTRDPLLTRIRRSPEFVQFLAEMKAENDRYRRELS